MRNSTWLFSMVTHFGHLSEKHEKRQLGGDSQSHHVVVEMDDKEGQSTDLQGQGNIKTKAKRKK